MRRIRLIVFLLIGAAMLATISSYANDPKRIERRIHLDSTVLTLSGVPKGLLHHGQKFTARIHVAQGQGWQISSVSASKECYPLQVLIPDSIARYFELVSLKETGRIVSEYDSAWEATRSYHREPFDLLATIKVRETVNGMVPFRLFVGYMTVNKTTNLCLPLSWHEVPLRKADILSN